MENLRIEGFKCFSSENIALGNITILTGNNGAGKSSVIQALLLLCEIVERCSKPTADPNKWSCNDNEVLLNDYHHLQLGEFDDIINVDSSEMHLGIDGLKVQLSQGSSGDRCTVCVSGINAEQWPTYLTTHDFYYLNAERRGPRMQSDIKPMPRLDCGDCGEWSGNVLLDVSRTFPKVVAERLFEDEGPTNFNIQVDLWMSHIFSEVSIKSEQITPQMCRIRLRSPHTVSTAPNTGFGYTYSLPIVIDCLLAGKGSLLIIENPEAHLHPKAQSNMGFFLGKMAASGLKIVVETHSEHIVNGIRRASLSNFGLNPEDVAIHFFTGDPNGCKSKLITIDDNGNLSDFPVDFFDQVRQDMLEIMRLAGKRNSKH